MFSKSIKLSIVATVLGFMSSATFAVESSQIVYGETTRLDSYDAYTVHEAPGQRLGDLLFDSLVEVGAGGDYRPSLAKSWKIEDGGTAVLFELNNTATWHPDANGKFEQVKPEDVVTTVRLLMSNQSDIPNRERFSSLKMAEKVTDSSVRVYFTRAMLDPLKATLFKIIPHHILGATPSLRRDSEFAKAPIGTGPYIFVKASNQGEVLLSANKKYFQGAPAIERIVMKSYADQSIMAQSLMYNSLDMITYVSPRDLGEVLGDAKLSVIPYDALSFSFFGLNTDRGILKDKRVRVALSHAVNRQEMMEAFFQNKGRLISGPFPPTSWAYNLDVKPLSYDVERAKKLLKETGLIDKNGDGFLETPAGKDVVLSFAVPLSGESEMIKRIVLAYQGYLEAVGVKLELQFMDWLVWKKKVLEEHDYDVTIASWSFDDASNITSLFHSSSARPWGNNFVMYKNSEVDSLLTEADATNDSDKRRAIYHKLHMILADDAPYTYLWTLMHHAAHNTRVSGVRVEPFSFFKHIVSWQLENKNVIK